MIRHLQGAHLLRWGWMGFWWTLRGFRSKSALKGSAGPLKTASSKDDSLSSRCSPTKDGVLVDIEGFSHSRRSTPSSRPQVPPKPVASDRLKKAERNLVLSNQFSALSDDEMDSSPISSDWSNGALHYPMECARLRSQLQGARSAFEKRAVFGLQGKKLTSSKTQSFSGFNILTKNSLNDRATGGVALLINKSYLFSEVHLNTPLQAVAARVTLNKVVAFCSIYLPSDHVAKTELINLIKQLPSPFVLLGDFSVHSPISTFTPRSYNSREFFLEDLFSELDLCILNDGSSTYIHLATGSTSALDLSICGPSLVLDYEWNIHEDLCGSDHFPVILTSNAVEEEAAPNRGNFKKADWLSFQAQCSSELTEEAVMSANDPAGQFTYLLIQAANKAIPKTRSSKNFPKFHGLMTIKKEQLKKERKLSESFF